MYIFFENSIYNFNKTKKRKIKLKKNNKWNKKQNKSQQEFPL